jgi:hypothetical protein
VRFAASGGRAGEAARDTIGRRLCPFALPRPAELDGVFTLFFSFLRSVPAPRYGQLVEKLSRAVTSGGSDGKGAAARLRVLANLYNAVDEGVARQEKLALFGALVDFAAETKQLEALYPYFATAASWQAKWGVSDAEARRLYLAVSRVLEKAGESEQAQAFRIRYLSTFEGPRAADIDDEALAAARQAAVGFVKAPAVSQRSALPQLAAVSAEACASGRLAVETCAFPVADDSTLCICFTCRSPRGAAPGALPAA